jgi:hypothetical protein
MVCRERRAGLIALCNGAHAAEALTDLILQALSTKAQQEALEREALELAEADSEDEEEEDDSEETDK